jgi:hypothetical protein
MFCEKDSLLPGGITTSIIRHEECTAQVWGFRAVDVRVGEKERFMTPATWLRGNSVGEVREAPTSLFRLTVAFLYLPAPSDMQRLSRWDAGLNV